MNNNAATMVITAIIALIIGGGIGYSMKSMPNQYPANSNVSTTTDKKMVLYQDMRRLWADHVIWTQEYINGTIDSAPGTDEAAQRLLKNQEDIGNALVPYYGEEAGSQLTGLLKDHITIAVELIAAAKNDDTVKFKNADSRWKANANDIATFLSTANSNWPKEALVEAMNMHLKTTTDEVVTRLNKKYDQNVASFDTVFDHIEKMADTLSAGIIKQFPDKF